MFLYDSFNQLIFKTKKQILKLWDSSTKNFFLKGLLILGTFAYTCAQSCLTLCDLVDCSPPGSSVHGIIQLRILEWVAISSSRGSSQPRDQTCISCQTGDASGFFAIGRWILYHWVTWEVPLGTFKAPLIIILLNGSR